MLGTASPPEICTVGQAETVAQAMDALRQLKPDAITLDLRLPDGNGLDVLRLIQQERLPTAAIVLTGCIAGADVRRTADGAAGGGMSTTAIPGFPWDFSLAHTHVHTPKAV